MKRPRSEEDDQFVMGNHMQTKQAKPLFFDEIPFVPPHPTQPVQQSQPTQQLQPIQRPHKNDSLADVFKLKLGLMDKILTQIPNEAANGFPNWESEKNKLEVITSKSADAAQKRIQLFQQYENFYCVLYNKTHGLLQNDPVQISNEKTVKAIDELDLRKCMFGAAIDLHLSDKNWYIFAVMEKSADDNLQARAVSYLAFTINQRQILETNEFDLHIEYSCTTTAYEGIGLSDFCRSMVLYCACLYNSVSPRPLTTSSSQAIAEGSQKLLFNLGYKAFPVIHLSLDKIKDIRAIDRYSFLDEDETNFIFSFSQTSDTYKHFVQHWNRKYARLAQNFGVNVNL